MKLPLLATLCFLCASSVSAELALRFVAPPSANSGTTRIAHTNDRVRFNGSTDPGATLTLNGEPVQVWGSGAFAGLLDDLASGENRFTFRATLGDETVTHDLTVIRRPPPQPLPTHPVIIREDGVTPSDPVILKRGDTVQFGISGSPGAQAQVEIAGVIIPLEENPDRPGQYRADYELTGEEPWDSSLIVASLQLEGESYTQEATGTMTRWVDDKSIVLEVHSEDRFHGPLYRETGANGRLVDLPEGTHLEVTGLLEESWRVRLTEDRHAWIPANGGEHFTRDLPYGTPLPRSGVPPITVSDSARHTTLAIGLDQPLPFIFDASDERTMTLTLFGITEMPTAPIDLTGDALGILSGVQWLHSEPGTATLVLTLNAQLWAWEESYDEGTLILELDHGPHIYPDSLQDITVIVDAGHGGRDPGAQGSTGAREKTGTLDMSLKMANHLRAMGARVTLLRSTDIYLGLNDRVNLSNEINADLFVSLHSNSFGMETNPLTTTGAQMYWAQSPSQGLAEAMQSALTGLEGINDKGIHQSNLRVVRPHQRPSVLAEILFMPNPGDEMKLLDPEWRDRMAKAMAEGMAAWVEDFRRERDSQSD